MDMDKELEERLEEMEVRRTERNEATRREVWEHGKEPLREWTAHGLRCFILAGVVGGPNGYVVVPVEHPWYAIHYHECPRTKCDEDWCEHRPESVIRVHGGITLSALAEDGWVFGFDTAHSGDMMTTVLGTEPGRSWGIADVAAVGLPRKV